MSVLWALRLGGGWHPAAILGRVLPDRGPSQASPRPGLRGSRGVLQGRASSAPLGGFGAGVPVFTLCGWSRVCVDLPSLLGAVSGERQGAAGVTKWQRAVLTL